MFPSYHVVGIVFVGRGRVAFGRCGLGVVVVYVVGLASCHPLHAFIGLLLFMSSSSPPPPRFCRRLGLVSQPLYHAGKFSKAFSKNNNT